MAVGILLPIPSTPRLSRLTQSTSMPSGNRGPCLHPGMSWTVYRLFAALFAGRIGYERNAGDGEQLMAATLTRAFLLLVPLCLLCAWSVAVFVRQRALLPLVQLPSACCLSG
jgi:hypothetical protein